MGSVERLHGLCCQGMILKAQTFRQITTELSSRWPVEVIQFSQWTESLARALMGWFGLLLEIEAGVEFYESFRHTESIVVDSEL